MPDIDPAALSRQDSISQPSASLVINKTNGASAAPAQKAQKPPNTVQRIDLEPLYTSLKAAIGDQWGKYKEATSLFVLGQLNQNELFLQIGHLFSADPSIEHLHNQLTCAIHGNVARDLPEQGVAPWVSANDKPTALSKPAVGDAAEQRLKTEVMQMPARDRRRLKEVQDGEITDPLNHSVAVSIYDYLSSKQIKIPDSVPASAGGLNKTNWDPEIHKHYTQPLYSETLEFPDLDSISLRMRPICFEESLPQGFSPPCAEYLSTATEQYIKDVIGSLLVKTRSNVGFAGLTGIRTHPRSRWKNKGEAHLEAEREREKWAQRPLNAGDLRFALGRGELGFGGSRAIVKSVMGGWEEGILEGWGRDLDLALDAEGFEELENGATNNGKMNGLTNGVHEDLDDGWGWEGGGKTDRMRLGGLLDECLAIGQ